jgi:hypothetical protein
MVIEALPTGKRIKRAHVWQRDAEDWYVEPAWVSQRLFDEESFTAGIVWDPACGSGRICKAAQAAGHPVRGSDLVDRGYGQRANFLTASPPTCPFSIVTNPPFKLAARFVLRGLDLGANKVAIVFPVRCLNAAHKWLTGLCRVWLLTPRPSMPPGNTIRLDENGRGGTVDYCWLVLQPGFQDLPELRWLHRDGGGR